jgi:hypothetical protein
MNGNIYQTSRTQNANVNIYDSAGVQAGENIATTPCSVFAVQATNKGAAVAYVHLFDRTSGPTGAPTFVPIAVPPGTTVSVSFNDVCGAGLFGLSCTSGLTWGASSTMASYTADSTDLWVSIRFAN